MMRAIFKVLFWMAFQAPMPFRLLVLGALTALVGVIGRLWQIATEGIR